MDTKEEYIKKIKKIIEEKSEEQMIDFMDQRYQLEDGIKILDSFIETLKEYSQDNFQSSLETKTLKEIEEVYNTLTDEIMDYNWVKMDYSPDYKSGYYNTID